MAPKIQGVFKDRANPGYSYREDQVVWMHAPKKCLQQLSRIILGPSEYLTYM